MTEFYVHPTAIVEDNVRLNENTKIWHFAQVRRGAVLGNNVVVGKSSYIGLDVKIGNDVKIQNLVSIFKGVELGDRVFIGPHVAFTNDMFPRVAEDWQICKTLVRADASIGANSTIICGTIIGEYALIGAGTVVTKDVPKFGLVVGNPGRLIGYVCYCAHKLSEFPKEAGHHSIRCSNCSRVVELDL